MGLTGVIGLNHALLEVQSWGRQNQVQVMTNLNLEILIGVNGDKTDVTLNK